MLDLQLISVWNAKREKNTYIALHSHNYHELVYYVCGKGTAKVGDMSYKFSDGCFALIPPDIDHEEWHSEDCEVYCLEFSGIPRTAQSLGNHCPNISEKFFAELMSEAKKQDYGYKEIIGAKLNELWTYILRSGNKNSNEKNFEYIINYLQENYHEKIVLSDCAKQLNLSYDYFQHKFKSITGCSPQQFLIKQRLKASKKLLKEGELNCTEIAFRCGFSTSAQYSALFKKEYGSSPLQYQKENR